MCRASQRFSIPIYLLYEFISELIIGTFSCNALLSDFLSGNGIINADGALWKVQRKAGLRFFSNSNLKLFIDETLPPILQDTKRVLDEAALSHSQIDLQSVLLEMTTRLMGKIAYDVRFTSLAFSIYIPI